MQFPGWDSIETCTKLHRWFAWGGILLLGVVVLAELIGQMYSDRAEALGKVAQQKSDDQINSLKQALGPWNISDEQIEKFGKAIDNQTYTANGFPGSVEVCYFAGDRDGQKLAERIWMALLSSDWGFEHTQIKIPQNLPANAASYPCVEEGILILAFPGDCDTPGTLATTHLRINTAFKVAGIPAAIVPLDRPGNQFSPGQIVVRVGRPPININPQ